MGDFVEGGVAEKFELLPVEYTGILPDMFAEGRDVIVEGTYVNGVLRAQSVMTSCPSKYEPAVAEAEAQAAKQQVTN
jgi:cytochrome c-type biogenesis protein CcmE